jgi:hypothetical protein
MALENLVEGDVIRAVLLAGAKAAALTIKEAAAKERETSFIFCIEAN